MQRKRERKKEYKSHSGGSLIDEIERREEIPVMKRSACSSRSDLKRPRIDDDAPPFDTWPNGSWVTRWYHYERFDGLRDPRAAYEKRSRKQEKRLRRAQIESNKDAPVNLAKD